MEEYGMKVWLEFQIKNLKEIKQQVESKLNNINIGGAASKAQTAGNVASNAGAIDNTLTVKGILKLAGASAAMLGVLYAVKKIAEGIWQNLVKSSPYLQGILKVFGRAFSLFFRPFGDFLATLLRPLAIMLLKLAMKWLQFTRTPAGETTVHGATGAGAGALTGAAVGGVLGLPGGPAGVALGAGAGALVGAMIGGIVGWLTDALQGVKNIWTIATAWLDELLKVFGINMDSVRVAVVTFIYETVPNFFTKTLPEIFNKGVQGIKNIGTWIWTSLVSIFTKAWESLKTFGTWLWDGITGAFSSAWDKIKGFGTWLWDGITGALDSAWETLKGLGKVIWNAIIGVINQIPGVNIPSAQIGLNHVPKTGLYKLHEGEQVVTAPRAKNSEKSKVNISNVFNLSGSNNTPYDIQSVITRSTRLAELELRARGYA